MLASQLKVGDIVHGQCICGQDVLGIVEYVGAQFIRVHAPFLFQSASRREANDFRTQPTTMHRFRAGEEVDLCLRAN